MASATWAASARRSAAPGPRSQLTGDPDALRRADALVLPGDGAFAATMEEVERRGLVPVLRDTVAAGKPLLGICIGMQLLFDESEEHGVHRGLGFLPGRVRRFEGELPVPHMGWNALRARQPHALLEGVPRTARTSTSSTATTATPPRTWSSRPRTTAASSPRSSGRGSVLGVQFHPEKSQQVGLRMVASFVAIAGAARRAA